MGGEGSFVDPPAAAAAAEGGEVRNAILGVGMLSVSSSCLIMGVVVASAASPIKGCCCGTSS